jgi:hypothetical protein
VREYYTTGKPVVLFGDGLVKTEDGAGETARVEWYDEATRAEHPCDDLCSFRLTFLLFICSLDWSVNGLKEAYGDAEIFISASHIHRELYGGKGQGMKATLEEYIDAEIGQEAVEDAGNDEPDYVFVTDKTFDTLIDTIDVPKYFSGTHYFSDKMQKIFALGTTNTGSIFHSHGDAWFALVHGKKRFLIYPNCTYLAATPTVMVHTDTRCDGVHLIPTEHTVAETNSEKKDISMVEWFDQQYQHLGTAPADCTIESGEIIYVPAGYQHGVINIGARRTPRYLLPLLLLSCSYSGFCWGGIPRTLGGAQEVH